MAKTIMIQGTMSSAGKSFLAAALCRIFRQDGYRVAPFKSQNMALNSYITRDGLEIGRAQAMQAEAAGIEPTVDMNPILLKPTSQMGSQVIVNGEVLGNMKAMDYYRRKSEFIPAVREAFARLEAEYEVIVLEGAGSPAEINLRDQDIVNMGMAKMAHAPVLLVGDIDRGGVFASLYGTVALLEPEERARIKGLVINKFRGDRTILEPGLRMIEERLGIPVVGVIPMEAVDLDDEDSLSERLTYKGESRQASVEEVGMSRAGVAGVTVEGLDRDRISVARMSGDGLDREPDGARTSAAEERLRISVIRLPHISNFTDFNCLERHPGVDLRYVDRTERLWQPGMSVPPDLILLPGTKNTMADLAWLRESGLETVILRLADEFRVPVIGICGGYQMLGRWLRDPEGVEAAPGTVMRGMGLLPAETVFTGRKTRTQIEGALSGCSKMFFGEEDAGSVGSAGLESAAGLGESAGHGFSGKISGYEIHMGHTRLLSEALENVERNPANAGGCGVMSLTSSENEESAFMRIRLADGRLDGMDRADGQVFGSYLHGLFDNEELTEALLRRLAVRRGLGESWGRGAVIRTESASSYKEKQYDRLADLVRRSLDMDKIYAILEESTREGWDGGEVEEPGENGQNDRIRGNENAGNL